MKKPQLIIIFLTVFIYLVGFGIVIPIIPILGRSFGASSLQVGLLMSVYSLMQFLFSPFWGKLSDRYGRRPIILFCLVGEGLSYLLFASARSLEMLFVARILAGLFSGSISTSSAYISDITPPHERSKGMALIGVAFGLGFIFGPAIGGLLTIWGAQVSDAPHFNTSFAAWWVAGICFANFLFALNFLKESLSPEMRKENIAHPTRKASRFGLMDRYFRVDLVGPMILVFFLSSLAMSTMEATLILFMGDKFSWSVKEVSFGFAYLGVMITLTQGVLVRRFIPKFGERKVLRAGLILLAVGLAGISLAPNIFVMALVMTLLAMGNGLSNPSSLGTISLLIPAGEQGVALGVTQSMASLGRIIGPAIGGAIYAFQPESPFLLGGALAACGLFIVTKIFHRLPESGKVSAGAH